MKFILPLLLVLFFQMSSHAATVESISRKCKASQAYTAQTDLEWLQRRLGQLLNTNDGIQTFDQQKVQEVYISQLVTPATNPYTNNVEGYYSLIHRRLSSGLKRIEKYLAQTKVVIQCEKVTETNCATDAVAYVEIDPVSQNAIDTVIHLCPAYFKAKNSMSRIGTLGHELSHQVLNTTHQGPKLADPKTYPNLASDAYVYAELFGSLDLEATLKVLIWKYFWFNDRSRK